MKTRLLHLWELLTTSFWFLPSVLVSGAAAACFLLLEADTRWSGDVVQRTGWLDAISADGARVLLGTLAGSSLTLMAISFSATIVSLTLAASQFGPRLLRNFMRSTTNQGTLGMLLATFVFSLLVLRNVRSNGDPFVPHFSILAAFLLMLFSLALFIRFIHRLSSSIGAEHVVADVLRELEGMIDEIFPENPAGADDIERGSLPCGPENKGKPVRFTGPRSGYLQAIDREHLMELAVEHDCFIELLVRPGDFVLQRQIVARTSRSAGAPDDDVLNQKISGMLLVGDQRTPEQDFLYGIRQLVEIALRALSPGINDPFTAIHCIQGLGVPLSRVADRPALSPCVHDNSGRPRVGLNPHSFDEVMEASFGLLHSPAAERPEIALTIVECLSRVASVTRDETRRLQMQRKAACFHELLQNQTISELDQERAGRAMARFDDRQTADAAC